MENMHQHWLPYQKKWLSDDSRLKIWEKSRRIGATYVQSFEDVIDCISGKIKNVWFSSADESAAREYIIYCDNFTRALNVIFGTTGQMIIDSAGDTKSFSINYSNGARINALTSNPTQFRSKGGKIVIDEFAHHKSDEELWRAAYPSVIQGYPLRILSTHNQTDTMFYKFVSEAREGKGGWSLHRTTINDAVEQGYVEQTAWGIRKRVGIADWDISREQFLKETRDGCMDEWTWQQEFLLSTERQESGLVTIGFIDNCNFVDGKWIFSPDSNVRPLSYVNNKIGKDGKKYSLPLHMSCDFNRDPNAWILGHKDDENMYYFDELVLENSATSQSVKEFLRRYPDHNEKIIINGDASGTQDKADNELNNYEQIIDALTRHGYEVELEIRAKNPPVENRIAAWNRRIRDHNGIPHVFMDPVKCPWLIYCCKRLSYIPGSRKIKDTFTQSQIEKNPKLKFLRDPLHAASYAIDYYWNLFG